MPPTSYEVSIDAPTPIRGDRHQAHILWSYEASDFAPDEIYDDHFQGEELCGGSPLQVVRFAFSDSTPPVLGLWSSGNFGTILCENAEQAATLIHLLATTYDLTPPVPIQNRN